MAPSLTVLAAALAPSLTAPVAALAPSLTVMAAALAPSLTVLAAFFVASAAPDAPSPRMPPSPFAPSPRMPPSAPSPSPTELMPFMNASETDFHVSSIVAPSDSLPMSSRSIVIIGSGGITSFSISLTFVPETRKWSMMIFISSLSSFSSFSSSSASFLSLRPSAAFKLPRITSMLFAPSWEK